MLFELSDELLLLLDVGEDLLELLVGLGEFLAADVEEFFTALGVGGEVVDAALRILHLLDKLFEFGHGLCISHLAIIFHCFKLLAVINCCGCGAGGKVDGNIVTGLQLGGRGDTLVTGPHQGIAASQGVEG